MSSVSASKHKRILDLFLIHGNGTGAPESPFLTGFGDGEQSAPVQELRNEVNQLRARLAAYGVGTSVPVDQLVPPVYEIRDELLAVEVRN